MSDDWTSLADGDTFDGWQATGPASEWHIEDGTIRCEGNNPIRQRRADTYDGTTYLVTEERYDDFEFAFDYRIEPGGNSGIYFRWSELTDRQSGMEIQILDPGRYDEPTKHTTGALYDMAAPTADPAVPYPDWNGMRLRCEGPSIQVWLNDERVLDVDIDEWTTPGENPDGTANKFTGYAMASLPHTGRLALQDHDERCWFRDLRLREL
ncbi:MAG: DUF1080 domain-containing protein [Halobacteriales archaeon]|nr:DUF1080 domain-containing protein [Halobacteriales archaeon]